MNTVQISKSDSSAIYNRQNDKKFNLCTIKPIKCIQQKLSDKPEHIFGLRVLSKRDIISEVRIPKLVRKTEIINCVKVIPEVQHYKKVFDSSPHSNKNNTESLKLRHSLNDIYKNYNMSSEKYLSATNNSNALERNTFVDQVCNKKKDFQTDHFKNKMYPLTSDVKKNDQQNMQNNLLHDSVNINLPEINIEHVTIDVPIYVPRFVEVACVVDDEKLNEINNYSNELINFIKTNKPIDLYDIDALATKINNSTRLVT